MLKTWLFFYWTLQIRGTVQQPVADGVAEFHKVSISSPVLPRPLSNLGGTIRVKNNQLCVEGLEGRVGRRGHLEVKGQLPIKAYDSYTNGEAIDIKAESLEVRARHTFRFVGQNLLMPSTHVGKSAVPLVSIMELLCSWTFGYLLIYEVISNGWHKFQFPSL